MKKTEFIFGLLFVLVALLGLGGQSVAATETENGAGFTMEALLPDNQLDDSSFFNLKVTPESEQNVTIRLTNLEDAPMELAVSPNPAFTNNGGVIEYSDYEYAKDSSAQYTIPELFSAPQKVTLQAQETKDITFKMTIPKEPFAGTIMGGFYALKTAEDATSSKQSLNIRNRYAMVMGISLQEDTETAVSPELQLNAIKPGLDNGRTAVFANIQNSKPQAFGEMTVTAKVSQKGSKEILHETKKENQEMAPNSNYDFAIDWENEPIEAGNYHLSMVATSGKKEWKFEEDFTIVDDQADKLNEQAVGLVEPDYTWLYILIAILLLLILVILAFVLGRRKRKTDESAEK